MKLSSTIWLNSKPTSLLFFPAAAVTATNTSRPTKQDNSRPPTHRRWCAGDVHAKWCREQAIKIQKPMFPLINIQQSANYFCWNTNKSFPELAESATANVSHSSSTKMRQSIKAHASGWVICSGSKPSRRAWIMSVDETINFTCLIWV